MVKKRTTSMRVLCEVHTLLEQQKILLAGIAAKKRRLYVLKETDSDEIRQEEVSCSISQTVKEAENNVEDIINDVLFLIGTAEEAD